MPKCKYCHENVKEVHEYYDLGLSRIRVIHTYGARGGLTCIECTVCGYKGTHFQVIESGPHMGLFQCLECNSIEYVDSKKRFSRNIATVDETNSTT